MQTGAALAGTGAVHAMIDISDGLAGDLGHICEESDVGAILERDLLETVIHDDARRLASKDGQDALEHALHDGEDFELAVVGDRRGLDALAQNGLLLRMGGITAEPGIRLRSGQNVTRCPA